MAVDIAREKELISRLKDGERAAFDALVEMYRNKGFAICYNLVGNAEDAKDVLQEAFIKVYLKIQSFKEESSFYTWFYRLAVNCSLDFLRKRKRINKVFVERMPQQDDQEPQIADLRYQPSTIILNEELARNMDREIERLPERQKACFVLKHQNGLSNAQIAQILGCGLSTVKVHLFRATKALQQRLEKYLPG